MGNQSKHKKGGALVYILIAITIFFALNHLGITAGDLDELGRTVLTKAQPIMSELWQYVEKYIIEPIRAGLQS